MTIKPWSFQVELVKGCQLRCPFCGINALGIPRGEFQFMTGIEAARVAREIRTLNPKGRIEFALRGEPLLNPKLLECISAFRQQLPRAQLQLTSNGLRLFKDGHKLIVALFRMGLNILLLDCYEPYGHKLKDLVMEWSVPARKHAFGDGFSPWNNHGPNGKHIILMPDLQAIAGQTKSRKILNQAGNSPMVPHTPEPLKKMCPIPWREVSIHVNGNVPICCMDFGCEYLFGNLFSQPLLDIWNGRKAWAARHLLRYGHRWFSPCCRCDGPLPSRNRAIPFCDKASEEDLAIVKQVIAISPRENGMAIEWRGDNRTDELML